MGGTLDGGEETGHAQDRSRLDSGRHPALDPPSAWQLDGSARAAIHLSQAHRDGRFDVDRLRSRSAARVAEDRAEDVADAASLAEEVFHVLGRDRAVLDPRTRIRAKPSAPTSGSTLRAGLLRSVPLTPALFLPLPLLP